MKKLYTLGIALAMLAFGTQSFAQVKQINETDQSPLLEQKSAASSDEVTQKNPLATAKDDVTMFFYEDFSNSFDGMEDNGAWTTGEENGNLWFHTFPVGAPNGYDPTQPLFDGNHPDYQDKLAAYWGAATIVNSPTRDNGVMMLDVDRYNANEDNEVRATLISPSIDLSALTQDETSALVLSFYQRVRLCCWSNETIEAEVSIDGGVSYVPYDVYLDLGGAMNGEVRLDISDLTGSVAPSTLTDVRIRFNWGGSIQTMIAYHWIIDDVSIQLLPDNDLKAHKTYTNNYMDEDLVQEYLDAANQGLGDVSVPTEYYKRFAMTEEPIYFARELNLSMVVENAGNAIQTGVTLEVTAIAPVSGDSVVWTSTPIELEKGVTETLRINNKKYSDINGQFENGEYVFKFNVVQNEADVNLSDNRGETRRASLTNEVDNGGYAMMRNDPNVAEALKFTPVSYYNDIIWGNSYVFAPLHEGVGPKYITHVEAVLLNAPNHAVTKLGELIYFNVREGSVWFENEALFGTSDTGYDDEELEFVIEEDDVWLSTTGLPLKWASFELPTPILITPGLIYQAEYRIPFNSEGAIVYPYMSSKNNHERFGTKYFDSSEDSPEWSALHQGAGIRFRTASSSVGLEKITVESGITLVQNYPNPFTDVTNIQFSLEEASKVNLEVRDLSGKLVFSKDFGTVPAEVAQRYELQRGSLAAGMYTYTIVTSKFQVSRKLTIQ